MPIIPAELRPLLGYTPFADVLLERDDGRRRLWIELEVSRADPVANHVKFATAQLFNPFPATDTFVSMVSPHVARGRRNLAASSIPLLRGAGLAAFQTVLLPHLSAPEVQRLNHLDAHSIAARGLDTQAEMERVFSVTERAAFIDETTAIHFAADILEVLLNVRQWNADLASSPGRERWASRSVTYFVYDPTSRQLAPAKFCAYVVVSQRGHLARRTGATMTAEAYAAIDAHARRFDGHQAWTHLARRLGMVVRHPGDRPSLQADFDTWRDHISGAVRIAQQGATILEPPAWF